MADGSGMPRNVNLYQDLCIFAGNAHPRLAASICEYLKMPLGEVEVFEFSNENIFVRVLENVRSKDVFIVQPLSTPVSRSVMELLIMIDAFRRASAGRITAVMPYYAYGRSDKKDQPRVPITARLLANLIETAGADRILTLDLHAGQIQGFFNIPVDELTALPLLSTYFRRRDLSRTTVLASDVGDAKRAHNIARMLGTPLAVVDKERVDNNEHVEANALIGDVDGYDVIIPDDEILTGGTIVAASQIAFERGARSVTAACVHPILSGSAVEKICGGEIRELVVTDTIPLGDKAHDKITVLSVAGLLGDAITRIHTGQSIGELLTALEAGGATEGVGSRV
jgi:ribose-phosphate pyrophosphokinase